MAEHHQPIPKTVFISYRRTNFPWALCIFQYLTQHGFDVFFDFEGIGPGDFESKILGNLLSRAHFLVVLTPSALERCDQPGDWLRREIETAIESKRNIVPLMIEGFSFTTPAIATQLTGKLATLRHYNGLGMPAEYFRAAMEKLRTQFLNVSPEAVPHPATLIAQQAAVEQQTAAQAAPPVEEKELTVQKYFERANASSDPNEQIRLYSEAIELQPDFAASFLNRGDAYMAKVDRDSAIGDSDRAIRFTPSTPFMYYNRGNAYQAKGNLEAAISDYNQVIGHLPRWASAYNNRGSAYRPKGDVETAIRDFEQAILLKPDHASAYVNRGNALKDKGDLEAAIRDYNQAIRLKPEDANAYYNRGSAWQSKGDLAQAISDLQRYLELAGGGRYSDTEAVQQRISKLQSQVPNSPS